MRIELSFDTEELQKRVKILQGKLDKQKQLAREYEAELKSQKQSVGGPVRMGHHQPLDKMATETSSQIDSKVQHTVS